MSKVRNKIRKVFTHLFFILPNPLLRCFIRQLPDETQCFRNTVSVLHSIPIETVVSNLSFIRHPSKAGVALPDEGSIMSGTVEGAKKSESCCAHPTRVLNVLSNVLDSHSPAAAGSLRVKSILILVQELSAGLYG